MKKNKEDKNKEMRKLTKQEIELYEKKLIGLIKEKNWLKYQIKFNTMVLEEGLKLNFEQKEKEYKAQLREFNDALKSNKFIINTLNEQIENGVEIKPEVKQDIDEKEDRKYVG